jgi:hypothetical protein
MLKIWKTIRLVPVVVAVAGCAPTLTQTALTNGRGRWQVAAEAGAIVNGVDARVSALPSAALAVRYGVTDQVDVGLRLGPGLVEGQGKFLLLDPGAARLEAVAVSVVPTLALAGADLAGFGPFYARGSVPVLVDVPVGVHRFTFGGRLAAAVAGAESAGLNDGVQVSAGASAAVALSIGDVVQLVPEVGVDVPFLGKATALPGASAPEFGVRLGVLFGGSPQAARSTP